MSIGSILHDIGQWFKKVFNNIKNDAAPVAITITEFLKQSLDSGLLKTIADFLPGNLPKEVLDVLQNFIPKILALELGLQGLPDDATPEQIQEFILSIEKAIGGKNWQEKSEFLTKYAVKMYTIIETKINNNPDHADLSFADIVEIVEEAYQAYKGDIAAATQN